MTTCKLITHTGKVCTDESKAKKNNKLNKNNYKQTEQQRTTYEYPPSPKKKQTSTESCKTS